MKVMILTQGVVRRGSAHIMQQERNFGAPTIASGRQLCKKAMLVYLEVCSEMIAAPNKTVETNGNKFGWRKCNEGRAVAGLWVFG
jgi:hypothetical protein